MCCINRIVRGVRRCRCAALRWPDRRCVIGAGLSLSAGRTASCVSGSDSVSAGHQSTNQHRRLVLSGQTLVYMEHCRSLYQRSLLSWQPINRAVSFMDIICTNAEWFYTLIILQNRRFTFFIVKVRYSRSPREFIKTIIYMNFKFEFLMRER